MKENSPQTKKSPDWIKSGLWAAFLISIIITSILAIRGPKGKSELPSTTLMEDTTSSNLDPDLTDLDDDRLLQANANRPEYK